MHCKYLIGQGRGGGGASLYVSTLYRTCMTFSAKKHYRENFNLHFYYRPDLIYLQP